MSTQTSGVDDADQEREQRADGETPTRLGRLIAEHGVAVC